jgi:hypothetical protein
VLEKPKGVPGAGGADKKGNPKQGAPGINLFDEFSCTIIVIYVNIFGKIVWDG